MTALTDDEKMLLVAKACRWTLFKDESGWRHRGPGRRWGTPFKGDGNDMAEIVAKLGIGTLADNINEMAVCWHKSTLGITVSIPANGNMKAALCRAVFEVAAKIGETREGAK